MPSPGVGELGEAVGNPEDFCVFTDVWVGVSPSLFPIHTAPPPIPGKPPSQLGEEEVRAVSFQAPVSHSAGSMLALEPTHGDVKSKPDAR